MPGVIGVSTADTGRFSLFYATVVGLERPADTAMMFARSAVISENRNTITDTALKSKSDWVLYLDDDHIIPPDTLTRLLAAEKDVISAHYLRRQPPFGPVLLDSLPEGGKKYTWHYPGQKDTGVVEVGAAGAGCLLVRRRVLEKMKPPFWTLGQVDPTSWGDDLDFCTRVREAGFKIHCDLDLPVGHFLTGSVWPVRDPDIGWQAHYTLDPAKGSIAVWKIPPPKP